MAEINTTQEWSVESISIWIIPFHISMNQFASPHIDGWVCITADEPVSQGYTVWVYHVFAMNSKSKARGVEFLIKF